MTSTDSHSAISSPASVAGQLLFDWPDGTTIDPSGPARAPVSHSQQPESETDTRTSGTCGQSSANSYGPSDPGSCSANKSPAQRSSELSKAIGQRLQEMLPSGSMEYRQTWKLRATPSGRQFWAHTASAHRTSDNVCSGWVSPSARDHKDTPGMATEAVNPNGSMMRENWKTRSRHSEQCLGAIAEMMNGWATPTVNDSRNGRNETATRKPGSKHNTGQTLCGQITGWNTPRATDGSKGGPNQTGGSLPADAARTHGANTESPPAETKGPGVLDPQLPCWLMGYPVAWLFAAPTDKPRRSTGTTPSER